MTNLLPPTPDELRHFRKDHGHSQVSLAVVLGISRRTVEDWERGRNPPPAYLTLALEALASQRATKSSVHPEDYE